MNIATVRTLARTALTSTLALAAFAFVATPQAAQAQGFSIGVQFGGQPAYGYVAPRQTYGYDRDNFRYERLRAEQFREHQEWERQQAFARQQEWQRQQNHFNHQQYQTREAYDRGYNNGWR